VSSQHPLRSLTYRHRCCRATSSMGAHFVTVSLVALRWIKFFGSMVYSLDVSVQGLGRVVTFCADRQVCQVYFFPAFSQRMYDMKTNFTRTKQSEQQICPKPGKVEEKTKPSTCTASIIILMASKRTLTASTVFLKASARPLNPLQ
jgi:hypothetical protein